MLYLFGTNYTTKFTGVSFTPGQHSVSEASPRFGSNPLSFYLVELALAERDSENAGVFFRVSVHFRVPGVLSGDRGNWG